MKEGVKILVVLLTVVSIGVLFGVSFTKEHYFKKQDASYRVIDSLSEELDFANFRILNSRIKLIRAYGLDNCPPTDVLNEYRRLIKNHDAKNYKFDISDTLIIPNRCFE